MSWKYKAAEKSNILWSVYFIVVLAFYHLLWHYSDEPYISPLNLFLSLGIVMLLGTFLNFPPSEYYQIDESRIRFSTTGLSIGLKICYLVFGSVFILISLKFTNDDFFSSDIFSVIFEILGLLLFLSAMYMQINKYLKNRKDFIQIDDQKITWHDDQTGNHEVLLSDLKGAIVKAKKVFHVELNTGEKHIIKLDELSLTAYAEVIEKELNKRGIQKL